MNIVIIGAGETGGYVAGLLSNDQHNVIVVDHDKKKLERLAQSADIATRWGSGSDWQLLEDLLEISPHMLVALTDHDDTNLVSCSLAKQLGYPFTIARVHEHRYFYRTQLDFRRIFDVDYFICPELLSANEILKTISSGGSLTVEYFAHGAVQLRIFKMSTRWKLANIPLCRLDLPEGVMVGLIYRKSNQKGIKDVIIPHGPDCIAPGDEVTFIGETEAIGELPRFLGIETKKIHSVDMIGGSLTAFHLAKLLEKRRMNVRIIEKNDERALFLTEHLPHTTIIHYDGLNMDFLRDEKVDQTELVIACARSDETNLMASVIAQEVGSKKVMMILQDNEHLPLLERLGIEHVVSPVISASNKILSQIFTGRANTLTSLYEHQAEVLELIVSQHSPLAGVPLKDLAHVLPKDLLIAMIQHKGRFIVARGNKILSPGDTVIVIMDPRHLKEVEKIF